MRRRKQESGFALLLVFVLAAAIAISLYSVLPRAAFESQRNKEGILIERGEQYKRGIQLFVAKNKRFPASMDELEKMGAIRYVRKRYVDPMTGKDDWRPIHVNAAGILTDSIIKKKEEKKENLNTFVSEGPSMAGVSGNETTGVNLALRRRASEQAAVNPQPNPDPNAPPPLQPPFPGDPNPQPQYTQQPGQPLPGQQVAAPFIPNQQQPFQQQPGQQLAPGLTGPQPTYPNNPATPYNLGYGTIGSTQTGQNPQQQPGQPGQPGQPAQPGNPALDLIGKILTSPRQQTMGAPGSPMGGQIGGGIAGFASKAEMPSIKVYNERQKYNEWEFVYDMKKDKRIMGQAAGMMGPQQQNPNQTQNQNQNTAGFGSFGQGQGQVQTPGQTQNQPGTGFGVAGGGFNQGQPATHGASGSGGSNSFITPGATIGSGAAPPVTNPNQTPNPNQPANSNQPSNPNQPANPNQRQRPVPGPQPNSGPF